LSCFGSFNRTAKLSIREALPDHGCGWRRKPPVRRTGRHVCAGEIMVLMARAALFSGYPVTLRAASHIHGVRMTVLSLPREAAVELTPEDFQQIENAASKIPLQGARYPEELQKLVGPEQKRATRMKRKKSMRVGGVNSQEF